MEEAFGAAPEPVTPLGKYRTLSPRAAIRVSPLQLGGMSIGEAWSSFMGTMNKEQSFKLLDAFVAAGGNFIDTAGCYQDQQSEAWIGEWMASRNNRDQIVIGTKYSFDYRSWEAGKGNVPNAAGNSKRNMFHSVRDSLRKLQTDYIDIFYLHWWDHTTSIEEVMDSLHILIEQGKVMYLGVSDTPAWWVSAANTYARAHGKTQFSVYQGQWNVLRRDFERDIIPMARYFGMALAPWDVIGSGHFQTAKQLAERNAKGEGLRLMAGEEQSEEERRISEALSQVASEHGIESVTAIAIAYVMSKTPNVFPVVGGRKVEHLHDNIQALSIRLTQKQVEFLESANEFDIGFPQNFAGRDPTVTDGRTMELAHNAALVEYVMAPKAIGY
ncbi:aryl-alcohol dehydrogenase AAD14 [Penicillium verrucosum]|uniref:aryl-alcohol dehydrogenase AAD14 n=1 Tax=Penicillium verrucosum TaxID=60171 RepID=UPI0025451552|nr:aryl-alcohol dehydrogenase AAD14 [Penicillium verrucosum]KAJ5922479.1 aryl-alcohol dehydrogenase AAD14 [Penicillium verrucosum]